MRPLRRLLASAPPGACVGVLAAGWGDAPVLDTPGRTVRRVGRDGTLSDLPLGRLGALAHLEVLRSQGMDALLVPTGSAWAAAVPGLLPALRARYAVRAAGTAGVLLDLRAPVAPGDERRASNLAAVVEAVSGRLGRLPSVLAWGPTGDLPGALVDGGLLRATDPVAWGLPHADRSVDLVVLAATLAGTDALAEARRVAVHDVVLLAPDPGADGRVAVASVERLEALDAVVRPSVSVIIPTYNDETMIAACLRSLWETVPAGIDVEVIVSDDGSRSPIPERVAELAAHHPGTRLVANPVNGGYIAAVSAGAAVARNEILVTLNNDTLLLPGWLEGLLDTFAAHPDAGVVGGRLIYPDGRLQEAGCVIFRDGSATKVGYGDDDPERAFYQHPRAVDYVSGALLATPRALYEELGGLDRAYGFGYYEDGDYCFRVRAAGRSVLYQPAATIVHVEGGTAGLDTTSGPKAFQVRNQRLFVERWSATLEHQPVRPARLDLPASRLLAASPGPRLDPAPTGVAA